MGADSRDSLGLEHAPESPRVEALLPDAPWADWWDGLEDGLTMSRQAVLVLNRRASNGFGLGQRAPMSASHDEHEQSAAST